MGGAGKRPDGGRRGTGPGDSSWSRGLDAAAGDVLGAIGLVLALVLRLFGVVPDALEQVAFLVSVVAVVARARAPRAQHRTRARPDRS